MLRHADKDGVRIIIPRAFVFKKRACGEDIVEEKRETSGRQSFEQFVSSVDHEASLCNGERTYVYDGE